MEIHPGGLIFFAIILLIVVIAGTLLIAWLLLALKIIKRIDWALMIVVITASFIGICWKILN